MSELVALPEWALTLYQPWAWLVAAGHKPIENRPRGFSQRKFRGGFWIHAGKEDGKKFDDAWVQAVGICHALGLAALANAMTVAFNRGEMPFGSIIGRATITGIIPPRSALLGKLDPAPRVPWHFPDQYGFTLENAVLLARPVPCRGWQGFWRVPAPVIEELKEAA